MKKIYFVILMMFLIFSIGKPNSITFDDIQEIANEEVIIFVDVRTEEEYLNERIPNAILVPLQILEIEALKKMPDKKAIYLVYCRSGNRSAIAVAQLRIMGYENVIDYGGINNWPYEREKG